MSHPVEVFCYAAETDQSFVERLHKLLAVQEQQGLLTFWEKSQISPGVDADQEVRKHLASAALLLLLISADFLADSYCYDTVLKTTLERYFHQEALTLPVIVRPAHWQEVPDLKRLQVLPKSGKPISGLSDQDNALWEVTKEIDKAIQRMETPPIRPENPVLSSTSSKISTHPVVPPPPKSRPA